MKIVTSLFLALAMASHAASPFPLMPAEELNFPAHRRQNALIANDLHEGSFTFLAGGGNGLVQYNGHRYDATSKKWVNMWDSKTATDIGLPGGVVGLARSKNLFMAVGDLEGPIANAEQLPKFAVSTDGRTWTVHSGTDAGWMKSLAYGNGTWVATGTKNIGTTTKFIGQIQYSKDDGATWHAVMLGDGETLHRACWNGTIWVAVGEKRTSGNGVIVETRIYTSADGATWSLQSSPGDGTLNSVVWGHGKWVAVGPSYSYRNTRYPIILNSADGISWTDVSPQTDEGGFLTDIDTTFFGYVAVGHNRVIHSFDGVQWEPVYTAPQATFRAVRTTPCERAGSRLYLLADTGRAFQDTLWEKASISTLRGAGRPSNAAWQRSADPLSVLRFVGAPNQGHFLDASGRRLLRASNRR